MQLTAPQLDTLEAFAICARPTTVGQTGKKPDGRVLRALRSKGLIEASDDMAEHRITGPGRMLLQRLKSQPVSVADPEPAYLPVDPKIVGQYKVPDLTTEILRAVTLGPEDAWVGVVLKEMGDDLQRFYGTDDSNARTSARAWYCGRSETLVLYFRSRYGSLVSQGVKMCLSRWRP